MTPEQIIAERPFAGFMTIASVRSLASDNALSGQAYIVTTTDGRRYKLRVCRDAHEAAAVEDNLRRFPRLFPAFYGRDGRYVLMEALEGYRNFTVADMRTHARAIGRMCAEIHAVQVDTDFDHLRYFRSRVDELYERRNAEGRRIIDAATRDAILRRHTELLARIRVRIGHDLHDLHPGNLMINNNGEVLFVDEGGLSVRVQGQGVAKVLRKFDEVSAREFEAGYREVAGEYFDQDYRDFVMLVDVVRSINFKTETQTNLHLLPAEWRRLDALIH